MFKKILLLVAVLIIPTTSTYAWGGRVVVRQPLLFRQRIVVQQPFVAQQLVVAQPFVQQRVIVRQRFVAPQCGIQAQAFSGGCASAAFFFGY